jgi:hypothetical protein
MGSEVEHMVDISSIAAALSSIKAAKDIAQSMIGLRDTAAFQAKLIEFQSKIIDANNAAFAAQEERTELIEKVRQLEKQVADLTAWETEKQRYELIEVSEGAFTYVLKTERRGGEPIHWLCASCYQNNKKSILQLAERNVGHGGQMHLWKCPSCRASILVQWEILPGHRGLVIG